MALLPNSSPVPHKFLRHRVLAAHSIAIEKAETRSEFVVATLSAVGWVERNTKERCRCFKSSEIQHNLVYTQENSETQHIIEVSDAAFGFAKFMACLKSLETIEVLVGCVLFFYPALPIGNTQAKTPTMP